MNDNEDRLLAERFHAAFRDIQRRLRQRLQGELSENARYNLTRVQFFLLRHLHRSGTLTISDLAGWMDVTPATLSTIVDRLERNRLVGRAKDSKDRRTVCVNLTEEGTALIGRVEQAWQAELAEELEGLSPPERRTLVELLERLNDLAKRERGKETEG